MAAPYHQLSINWDFDPNFKYNFFNEKIISTGCEIILDYFNTNKFFYEIDAQVDSSLKLSEANSNCPFASSLIRNPFLFIRNIGTGFLYIESSSASNSGNYFSYFDQRATGKNIESCNNFKLNPSEAVFFYINSTEDGSCYYSTSCYELGFNYSFLNLDTLNLSNIYPSFYYCYQDISGLYGQLYNYESFSIGNKIANKGCCSICGLFLNQNKTSKLIDGYHVLPFDESNRICFVCDPNSGNYDFFNFSGCFNFEVVATPEDATQERIFMGKGGGSNGWGSNGQAWYTVFNVNGFSIGMSLGGGNFQTIGFPLTGSGLAPCLSTGCFYHLMMSSDDCCFSIYINGVRQGYADCSVCSIVPYLYPLNTNNCTFIIGANTTDSPEKFYSGNIKNIKYSTGAFPYSLDASGNFIPCEDILNCNQNALLLINFPDETVDTNKFKTYYFSNPVDDCAIVNINFSGTGVLNSGISIVSFNGNNFNSGCFSINSVLLYENENLINSNIYSTGVSLQIKEDKNLCLIYKASFTNDSFNYYYYCISGDLNSSSQFFYCDNNIFIFDQTGKLIENTGYCLFLQKDFSLYVDIDLCESQSIKDLNNLNLNRLNIYFPDKNTFNYKHCYLLANANHTYESGISGNWNEAIICLNKNFYENYTNLINTGDPDFILNSSLVCNINFSLNKNKFATSCAMCKEKNSCSESFSAFFSPIEKSFFYSGLEYRYFPLTNIFYKNCNFEIPDICIPITLDVTGKCLSLNYPAQALSLEKLKIISNTNLSDFIDEICLSSSYEKLNLNYCFTGCNDFILKYLKLRCENLSGFESPDVYINGFISNKIEDESKLYLDPYENFELDRFYGLNNFLFFIASYLNNGIASQCECFQYQYQEIDYNFLMIDLENEFFENSFIVPSGTGFFQIDEKNICCDYILNKPFPFKSSFGNGYNYLLPIRNSIYYSGDFCHIDCGFNIFEKSIYGNLNFKQTGFSFIDGFTGECEIYDETGFFSGIYTGFLEKSNFVINNSNFSFFINNQSLNQTESGRNIFLSNSYFFTGVQPILIKSNYALFDVKEPILYKNLSLYCELNQESEINDCFYITYDFSKKKNTNLKFISPYLTQINYICWSDQNLDNKINYLSVCSNLGKIQLNAANIKYCSENLFHENKINLNCDNISSVCINILGGLL